MTRTIRKVPSMAAALALCTTPLPAAASPAGDAKSACRNDIRRNYNAGTSSVTASERNNGRFVVQGVAERRGEYRNFTCRTDDGRVQTLFVAGMSRETGGGNDTGKTVAAVGAAVALAAIIAAASSKRKSHEYDRYDDHRGNDYYRPADRGDSYRPASGVICYRRQRACYNSYNDSYLSRWTHHEFGY